MPQKPLTSKGKKSLPRLSAANRHGKLIKHKKGVTRDYVYVISYWLNKCCLLRGGELAGAFNLKPKKDVAKQIFEDQKVCSLGELMSSCRPSSMLAQHALKA